MIVINREWAPMGWGGGGWKKAHKCAIRQIGGEIKIKIMREGDTLGGLEP